MTSGLVGSTALRYRVRNSTSGGHRRGALSLALVIVSSAVLIADLLVGPRIVSAGLRSALETAIVLSALLSTILLRIRFRQTRLLRDLLLLATLATVAVGDFVLNGLPALSISHAAVDGFGARGALMVAVASGFVAVAFVPGQRRVPLGSRLPAMIAPIGIGIVALAEVIDLIAGPAAASSYAATVPVVVAAASVAMLIAGLRFLGQRVPGRLEAEFLAGGSLLLAGAWLQKLVWPLVAPDWVTLGDASRLAAYGLLLATALRLYGRTREQQAREALSAERLRIARDLHDGLAQDLAFIATHSDRLAIEFGAEHPLAIATRRALAVSRQEIVDLSASDAPDVEFALREVASELAARFEVEVEVEVDDRTDLDLKMSDRTELVRIAREAIVNAVRHGGARKLSVTLGSRWSGLLLRVVDDGCGIDAPRARARPGTGLGMEAMRARARLLGGQLVTRRRAGGGTQLDVVAPQRRTRSAPPVDSARPRARV
ncbi:MAG: sensor histidine kinase [Solirubrobacteraceae bacterium]